MKDETKIWIERAREDLEAANFNYQGGIYKVASFLCQQAAEKALKGYLLEKTGRIRKIHDLVALGKDAQAPEDLLDELKEMTLAYVYARYPDVQEVKNLKQKASKFLETAEQVLKWVKSRI